MGAQPGEVVAWGPFPSPLSLRPGPARLPASSPCQSPPPALPLSGAARTGPKVPSPSKPASADPGVAGGHGCRWCVTAPRAGSSGLRCLWAAGHSCSVSPRCKLAVGGQGGWGGGRVASHFSKRANGPPAMKTEGPRREGPTVLQTKSLESPPPRNLPGGPASPAPPAVPAFWGEAHGLTARAVNAAQGLSGVQGGSLRGTWTPVRPAGEAPGWDGPAGFP